MMNRSRVVFALATLLVATGTLGAKTASAQDEEAARASDQYDQFEDAAWEEMQEGLLTFLTEDGASRLVYIAYHDLVANLCEGVTLDGAKVSQAVADLHPDNWDELTDEDHTAWTNKFYVNYGMAFGVLLAEHASDRGPFCEQAMATIADEEEREHSYFNAGTN